MTDNLTPKSEGTQNVPNSDSAQNVPAIPIKIVPNNQIHQFLSECGLEVVIDGKELTLSKQLADVTLRCIVLLDIDEVSGALDLFVASPYPQTIAGYTAFRKDTLEIDASSTLPIPAVVNSYKGKNFNQLCKIASIRVIQARKEASRLAKLELDAKNAKK